MRPSAVPRRMRPRTLFRVEAVNLVKPWVQSKMFWYSVAKFVSLILSMFIKAIFESWPPIRKYGQLKDTVQVFVGSLYSEIWKLFPCGFFKLNTLITVSKPKLTTTSYFSTQTTLQTGAACEPNSNTLLTLFISTSPTCPEAKPTMTSRSPVISIVMIG